MNAMTQNKDIISNWQPKHAQLFGEQAIKLNHTLIETGLFSREAVAKLIENCPEEEISIFSRSEENGERQTHAGTRAGISGEDALRAIESGHVWMNIRRIMDWSPEYKAVLDKIFAEFEARVPGLETSKHNIGVLVSSPNAKVFYHADIQGQSLWQISGKKRVRLYPNTEVFVPARTVEKILLREKDETVNYQPWFEEYAQSIDLNPGEMITWPLYAPHQVDNYDCLNISVTMEHWTKPIWNAYAVHYGNGVLRRLLGLKNLNNAATGLHVYAKAAAAFAWKKLGMQPGGDLQKTHSFRLDANAPNGVTKLGQ